MRLGFGGGLRRLRTGVDTGGGAGAPRVTGGSWWTPRRTTDQRTPGRRIDPGDEMSWMLGPVTALTREDFPWANDLCQRTMAAIDSVHDAYVKGLLDDRRSRFVYAKTIDDVAYAWAQAGRAGRFTSLCVPMVVALGAASAGILSDDVDQLAGAWGRIADIWEVATADVSALQ